MAYALLKELQTENGEEHEFLDEETVRLVIADIMAAGILTSSVSLCAFIHIISAYPEIQEKLHQEVLFYTAKCNNDVKCNNKYSQM